MKKSEILKKLGTAASPGSALGFDERLACREAAELIKEQSKRIAKLNGALTERVPQLIGSLEQMLRIATRNDVPEAEQLEIADRALTVLEKARGESCA